MVECIDSVLSNGGEEIDGDTNIYTTSTRVQTNSSRLVSGSSGSKWGSGDGRRVRVGWPREGWSNDRR
jgi:hypothetical protein